MPRKPHFKKSGLFQIEARHPLLGFWGRRVFNYPTREARDRAFDSIGMAELLALNDSVSHRPR